MKKTFLLIFLLVTVKQSFAQLDSTSCRFSILHSVSFENMIGYNSVCGPNNSDPLPLTAFGNGFRFTFGGIPYDSFSVCPNGWLRLGNLGIDQLGLNYATRKRNFPVIGPYWLGGHTGSNGYVISKTFGTAPNRKFVIEWFISATIGGAFAADSKFELWLFENGNIQVVFGVLGDPVPGHMDYKTFLGTNVNGVAYFVDVNIDSPIDSSIVAYNGMYGEFTSIIPQGTSFLFSGDTIRPASPTIVQVDTCVTCIKMTWQDNSTNEYFFHVLKSTDSINFNVYKTIPTLDGPGTGGLMSFRDTLLSMDSTYWYKIIASTRNSSDTNNTIVRVHTKNVASLQGIKNIPGDYPNLTEAFASFSCDQLAGPVICELTPAYTSSSEEYPLHINDNVNTDSIKTITVRPSSTNLSASITKHSTNMLPMFDFSNIHDIYFDGRSGGTGSIQSLIIENEDTTGPLMNISNGCHHLEFKYCDFRGACRSDSTPSIMIGGSSTSFGNRDITFSTNKLHSGLSNSTFRLVKIQGDTLKENHNIQFIDNEFFDIDLNNSKCYMISANKFADNLLLQGNSFYFTSPFGAGSSYPSVLNDFNPGQDKNYRIYSNCFGGTDAYCGGPSLNLYGQVSFVNFHFAKSCDISFQGNISKNINSNSGVNILSGYYGRWNVGDSIPNIIGDLNDTSSIVCNTFAGIAIAVADTAIVRNNFIGGIQSYGSNYCLTVGATHSIIEDNIIGNPDYMGSVTTNGNQPLIGISAYGNYLSVSRNKIGGLYAMSSSNNGSNYATGIDLFMGSVSGYRNLNITENEIRNIYSNSSTSYIWMCASCFVASGIHAYTRDDTVTIGNNHIHNIVSTNSAVDGLDIMAMNLDFAGSDSYVTISGNYVHGVSIHSTDNNNRISGIRMNNEGYDMISNNIIGLHLDSVLHTTYTGGINGIAAWADNIIHNTISVSKGFPLHIAYGPTVKVYNNILNSLQGFSPILNLSSTGGVLDSDYNLFSGDSLELVAWQALGADQNSLFGNPLFLNVFGNDSTLDLHVQNGSQVESAGDSTNTVTFDFDNETRHNYTPVDIGADAINYLPVIVQDPEAEPLLIYPNPATQFIRLKYALIENKATEITIYNLYGQIVMKQKLKGDLINLENLAGGTYLLEMEGGNLLFRKLFQKL